MQQFLTELTTLMELGQNDLHGDGFKNTFATPFFEDRFNDVLLRYDYDWKSRWNTIYPVTSVEEKLA